MALYQTWGCFVATGFLGEELALIRREAGRLIELATKQASCSERPTAPHRFEDGFAALEKQNPAAAAAVFGAARRLTSVHQLSVHPRLLALSQHLMKTDMVMSSPYKPVRIDYQGRQESLLPWHQDYPYAQDSMDAVVYWIPLQDVDNHNGCVVVAPGSHRSGIYPVTVLKPAEGMPGPRQLRLADAQAADPFPQVAVSMAEGDVLVFSALLLHRSQTNSSDRVRWTVQIRHGNFEHPSSVEKHWPRGHYESHWFDETHPEHVAELVTLPRSG